MLLFVNACVRKNSRTKELALALIEQLEEPVTEEILSEISFPVCDEEFLKKRDALVREGLFSDSTFALARRFAEADTIVIAAPYWDLSFPARLKAYFEQINVVGITFRYSEEGIPVSGCKAKRLYYVTTAGGKILSDDFGFGYVKALANNFYGIEKVECLRAEGLDILGANEKEILKSAKESISLLLNS